MYNPSNMQGIFPMGVLLSQIGDFQGAIEKFQKVNSMLPFHSEALYYLAFCFFQLKNFKSSTEYARKAIIVTPDKLESHILLAESYMNLNEEERCFNAYEKALSISPLTMQFYSSWGLACQNFQKVGSCSR